MPFDGTRYEGRIPALDKMDKVIDLLSAVSCAAVFFRVDRT